jgi:hypothetical protein
MHRSRRNSGRCHRRMRLGVKAPAVREVETPGRLRHLAVGRGCRFG